MSPIKFILLTKIKLRIKTKIVKGICLPDIGRVNSLVKCLSTNIKALGARILDVLKTNQFEVELKNRRPKPKALQFKASISLV